MRLSSSATKAVVAIVVVLALAAVVSGCRTAKVGTRCRGNVTAQDRTHVLVCKRGRWVRLMTKQQAAALWARLLAARTTTTTTPPATTTSTTTTTVPLPPPVYAISSGYQTSCRIKAGAVQCVGDNPYGDLGDGTTTDSLTWQPTGITDATAVTVGSTVGCAIRSGGTVKCWGFGGQLGDGTNDQSTTPVDMVGVSDATQISMGSNGGCLRTTTGAVKCWGSPWHRGDGNAGAALAPVTASITGVVKVSAGGRHACALKTDGTVWCWGKNDQGQLGDGSTTDSLLPVQVAGLTDVVDVAAGGFNGLSCAVRSNGTVWCWGDDQYSQLGDGDMSASDALTPTQVVSLSDATKIAVGFYNACAIRSGGGAKCWGLGGFLGNGSATSSSTPVDVTGITNAVAINGQGTSTCVLLSTNGAKCWGANGHGQLGDGTTDSGLSPRTVIDMP